MFLNVTDVIYLDDYRLRLTFNNGVIKDVDLHSELQGEIFEPLKDKSVFRQVEVNSETNTIQWSNGADFAPEFLYEIGQEVERTDSPTEIETA